MFRLTREEAELSRSRFALLKSGRGQNIKYLPHAELLASNKELSRQLDELEAGDGPSDSHATRASEELVFGEHGLFE